LELLLKRKGIEALLKKHLKRETFTNLYRDIYDGEVWKENREFFAQSGINLGLMLNIDWFCPFSRTKLSVGAIYLSIMNLPRDERFKKENMILVGVIPGPKEPDVYISFFSCFFLLLSPASLYYLFYILYYLFIISIIY